LYRYWGSVQAVRPIGGVEVQLYPFMTMALEGGEGSVSHPGRSLPLGKNRYPLYRRWGGPQGRSGQVWKSSPPPGFDPRTVQPVASPYTDYVTRPTFVIMIVFIPHFGNRYWVTHKETNTLTIKSTVWEVPHNKDKERSSLSQPRVFIMYMGDFFKLVSVQVDLLQVIRISELLRSVTGLVCEWFIYKGRLIFVHLIGLCWRVIGVCSLL
jgi:hypothetical protein